MRRCSKCVMPDTRPDMRFDAEGVCSACRAYEMRPLHDQVAKKQEFRALMKKHKTHPVYDCVVGSSGGKDSHYIVIKALELGYKPLVVTATTDFLTELGRRNIENLKSLGVDTIEWTPNPVLRRKLCRIALEEVGDIEWPEHCAIFSTPVRVAKEMGIGVVLYGENPQNDLSGGDQEAIRLDQRWREEYGGLLGLRPSDLVGREGITAADMWPYVWPENAGDVYALFLGQFFPWDGWRNALIAQAHGFETYPGLVEGDLADFENLDNADIGIHDYFGFLKYGFGRASVIASLHVRRGRLTRAEAVMLARKLDGAFPLSYLGVPLASLLTEMGMTQGQFDDACDRFANTALLRPVNGGGPGFGPTGGRWQLKEFIS